MPLLGLWDALLRDEEPTTKTKPQDSGYFNPPLRRYVSSNLREATLKIALDSKSYEAKTYPG